MLKAPRSASGKLCTRPGFPFPYRDRRSRCVYGGIPQETPRQSERVELPSAPPEPERERDLEEVAPDVQPTVFHPRTLLRAGPVLGLVCLDLSREISLQR